MSNCFIVWNKWHCEDNLEDLTLLLQTHNPHITMPRPYMICHTLCHTLVTPTISHSGYYGTKLHVSQYGQLTVVAIRRVWKSVFWPHSVLNLISRFALATPRCARTPQFASLYIKLKTLWGKKTDFHSCLNGDHSLLTILWHNNNFSLKKLW